MNACAAQDFKQADAALNAAYTKLMGKITSDGQASLRAAQIAWLAYRDKECAFETRGSAEGSVNPMVLLNCKTALTQAQTKRLDAQLSCQEGDASCGGQ